MLQLKFYETYQFCNVIRNILTNQQVFLIRLHEFSCDGAYLNLLEPFEKYSALHKFIEFVIDDLYSQLNTSVDLDELKRIKKCFSCVPEVLQDVQPEVLPLEEAFNFYGIEYESFSSFFQIDDKSFENIDADDIYDYMSQMRLSAEYDALITKSVREVFHILFQDRMLLLIFNNMLANVLERSSEEEIPDEYQHLFSRSGILARKTIPKWVKRAVFYRDKGRCVLCSKDLSGTLNIDNTENYDHIVPLSKSGFNDITNIQLLCKQCNQIDKKDRAAITSDVYHSWYAYD